MIFARFLQFKNAVLGLLICLRQSCYGIYKYFLFLDSEATVHKSKAKVNCLQKDREIIYFFKIRNDFGALSGQLDFITITFILSSNGMTIASSLISMLFLSNP